MTIHHAFARIMLATEHTESDAGAERLAYAISRHGGTELRIVLPLPSNPEYEAHAPQLVARAEVEAGKRLAELADLAKLSSVTIDSRVRRGPESYREIVAEALERQTDLIVIRRRGQRGLLANLLLGEMVRNVVAHAPCNVLVAPRGADLWRRRVMVAIDPQSTDLSPITTAAAIAVDYAIPLSGVAVFDAVFDDTGQADAMRQRVSASARSVGVSVDVAMKIGKPHQQILANARDIGADLIVIGRHGGESSSRVWLGGVAQKIIGLAELPVLVCVNSTNSESPTP